MQKTIIFNAFLQAYLDFPAILVRSTDRDDKICKVSLGSTFDLNPCVQIKVKHQK